MKIRIISINKPLSNDEIVQGNLEDAPSISDFDALVIDPQNVLPSLFRPPTRTMTDGTFIDDMRNDGGHGKRIISIIEQRKNEIGNLLTITQGLVICYLRRMEGPVTFLTPSTMKHIANYSWLPDYSADISGRGPSTFLLPSYIISRESIGAEVSIADPRHPFSQYFKAFKTEIRFECTFRIERMLQPFVKVLAQNKVKEVVACEISMGGGKLIFLPPIESSDLKKETGVLLDCIGKLTGRSYMTPPPKWIEGYILPGEIEHESEIEKLAMEIGQLEKIRRDFEEKQENVARFKGLLYEKGKVILESLVRDAFRILGFEVLEPGAYPEEYDLYVGGSEVPVIGEIEGTDNSMIDNDKVRQLLDYIDLENRKGTKSKGILIGNSRRGTCPVDRESQFTDAAIELAQRLGYCLLTTCQLFELVKKVLSGISADDVSKIKQSILSSVGEYKLN